MTRPDTKRPRKAANENLTPLKCALFQWAEGELGLKGNQLRFIKLLASFANSKDATAWINRREFAKANDDLSVRSITTFTTKATSLGLIEPTGRKSRCGRALYRIAPNDQAVQSILDAANDNSCGKSGHGRGKFCAAYKDDPQDHYFNSDAEGANRVPDAELVPVPDHIKAIYRRVFNPDQMFSYIENARWHDASQSLYPATARAATSIPQKDDGLSKALKFRIVSPVKQVRHG